MDNTEQERTVPAPFTPRKERALAALLEASSMDTAAKRAGVCRTTLYSWLEDEPFQSELRRRQSAVFRDALLRLKAAVGSATAKLVELVASADERVALVAAREILGSALRAHEALEVEERLVALETRLATATGGR